jgi:ketosteroid isomerase-like protein
MNAAENKQLMQQIFEGLRVGDSTLFRERLAEDARLVVMGKSSWSQTREGLHSMTAYWRYVRSIFKSASKTVAERFIADGDVVAVETRGDNESAAGERYDNFYCLVFRFADGKIVEMREYMDTAFTEKVFGAFPDAQRDA